MRRLVQKAFAAFAVMLVFINAPGAFAASAISFAEITGITLTGSGASIVSTSEYLTSTAFATDGSADFFNDGMTFESMVGPDAEGTATNSGLFGAISFADAFATPGVLGTNIGSASTFSEFFVETSGSGSIFIDVDYELDVDSFDNLAFPDGEAFARVELSDGFDLKSDELSVDGFLADMVMGTLSLEIPVYGPYDAFSFFVSTESSAVASAVPVPAAVWLFGSALAGLMGFRRVQRS